MNNIKLKLEDIVGEALEDVIIDIAYRENISFEEASDKVYDVVLKWCGITKSNIDIKYI